MVSTFVEGWGVAGEVVGCGVTEGEVAGCGVAGLEVAGCGVVGWGVEGMGVILESVSPSTRFIVISGTSSNFFSI